MPTNPISPPTLLQSMQAVSVIFSAVAAALAAIFVAWQVRRMRQARDMESFLRIIELSQEEHLRQAADWVKYEMDRTLPYEAVFADREAWAKISAVIHYFEVVGTLCHFGYLRRSLLYDQMGPWVAGSWEKLKGVLIAHRRAKNAPDYCENFELLVEKYYKWARKNPPKLEKRPRTGLENIQQYYK